MQKRSILGALALLVFLSATPVKADLLTFDVDISAVVVEDLTGTSVIGDVLRVFGTIMVDPTLPFSAEATFSNLSFQHNLEAPVTSSSNPLALGSPSSSLGWRLDNNTLFIDRISNENSSINWSFAVPDNNFSSFSLGSGTNSHNLLYGEVESTHLDLIELKAASGPDGPNGFLVGTVSAIPEPSSFVLLSGIATALATVRRRKSLS